MVSDESSLAYSLAEDGGRWAWRVFDRDGRVVAAGAAHDKSQAYDEVSAAYASAAAGEGARRVEASSQARSFRLFGASPPPPWQSR